MVRSCRNVRSTRGENWLLANCSTTMVMDNTSAVKVIIAWVIEDSKLRAPSGGPGNRKVNCDDPIDSSTITRPSASPLAAVMHSAGTSQNAERNTYCSRLLDTMFISI